MSLVCTAPLRQRLPHGTRYAFIRSAYESYRGREQEKAGRTLCYDAGLRPVRGEREGKIGQEEPDYSAVLRKCGRG